MKTEIYKLYPKLDHTNDTVDILEALIEATKEAWHIIDHNVLYSPTNPNLQIDVVHTTQHWQVPGKI